MRLLALALHRLAWFVPTLLGLLVVTFVISRVIPADPVALVAGETATPAQVEALRRQLGYDRPLPVQFVQLRRAARAGRHGHAASTRRRPIVDDLAHAAAGHDRADAGGHGRLRRGRHPARRAARRSGATPCSTTRSASSRSPGLAIASFWLGIMLQLLFAMRLGWTPLNGRLQGFPPPTITGFYLAGRRAHRRTGRRSAARCCTWRCPRPRWRFRRWPRSCASPGRACWT